MVRKREGIVDKTDKRGGVWQERRRGKRGGMAREGERQDGMLYIGGVVVEIGGERRRGKIGRGYLIIIHQA